jgi:hypothetical protein
MVLMSMVLSINSTRIAYYVRRRKRGGGRERERGGSEREREGRERGEGVSPVCL